MEILICPVCGEALKVNEAIPNVYACTLRKIWLSDFDVDYKLVDTIVRVDLQTGKWLSKLIEIPPYIFFMIDNGNTQRTDVYKLISEKIIPGFVDNKMILSLNCAMNLP